MSTLPKPDWLRVKYSSDSVADIKQLMQELELNTVCREANCPNLGECYRRHTATFMILGSVCTRNCRFCDVHCGKGEPVDPQEPEHLAKAAKKLGAHHVVVTSVDRDDLPDGGAGQFAAVIQALRQELPNVTVEVLIPDFGGNREALNLVLQERPEVLNHNVETVKELFAVAQPQADYELSLNILSEARTYAEQHSAKNGRRMLVKSGIMLGLGETDDQLKQLFQDLAAHGCDILTIGQYLQPGPQHLPLQRYVSPAEFKHYEEMATAAGLAYVVASPLVRSSYRADEALAALQKK